jgi:hypothetical protein
MAEAKVFIQAVKRMGDFDGVEILPLNVLDERDFHQPVISELLNDDWHLGKIRDTGCAPSALSGHKLIVIMVPPDHNRLDDAVLPD